MANELIKADIFVMASHHFDTQGIVLLEAAAAGLPIVYCDDDLNVGVEPCNSLLTKPDVRSLAAGLKTLLHDPLLRHQMSIASVGVTKQYAPVDLTNRLVDFYSAAIQNYRFRFGLDPL